MDLPQASFRATLRFPRAGLSRWTKDRIEQGSLRHVEDYDELRATTAGVTGNFVVTGILEKFPTWRSFHKATYRALLREESEKDTQSVILKVAYDVLDIEDLKTEVAFYDKHLKSLQGEYVPLKTHGLYEDDQGRYAVMVLEDCGDRTEVPLGHQPTWFM